MEVVRAHRHMWAKNGNVQIKIGIEKRLQVDVPLSPLDSITHVLGSFLSSPVKLNCTSLMYFDHDSYYSLTILNCFGHNSV